MRVGVKGRGREARKDLPAEQVEDERVDRDARRDDAQVLARADGLLERLAEGDEVVHLLQQLRAYAAEEARGRDDAPQLKLLHDERAVHRQRLGREQPNLAEEREADDESRPYARHDRHGDV